MSTTERHFPIRSDAVSPPNGSVDSGIPWHYGDPHAEQRSLQAGDAVVDLSNRGVVRVSGGDRLTWLTDLTTQRFAPLAAGDSLLALILDPHGHVEHELHAVDDGTATWLIVAPGTATEVVRYLDSMRFMLDVAVSDESANYAVIWAANTAATYPTWTIPAEFRGTGVTESGEDRGGDASKYVPIRPGVLHGVELIVPIAEVEQFIADVPLAGSWAFEAERVAAAVPRVGLETDHKTLPHEVGWIGPGVHLAKGCYRGQEAVARVHNMGRAPRRLVLLHLDGSVEQLPKHGDAVLVGDKVVGWIATPARHYELGPIATAVIKRSVPTEIDLTVNATFGDGQTVPVAAGQQVVVAP